MARDIHHFTYGTLQKGLSNYADMTDVLGEPKGLTTRSTRCVAAHDA
jgi:hypothetical protein